MYTNYVSCKFQYLMISLLGKYGTGVNTKPFVVKERKV